MFDYHLHSSVSFDSEETPQNIIRAAVLKGLSEICFTDHYDYNSIKKGNHQLFKLSDYTEAYSGLDNCGITVKQGVEFGLTEWDKPELEKLVSQYPFDFVLGSVHFIDGIDPYEEAYWRERTVKQAFEEYLLGVLECVRAHDGFDVLGHINYVCKSAHSHTHEPLLYKDFPDICDEIMKELVKKGKGMEINTSGVDSVGTFLPSKDFFVRFRELGGEIVTVGSDAHNALRVGQYTGEALEILKEVFGYVCTFENRKPIFNRL